MYSCDVTVSRRKKDFKSIKETSEIIGLLKIIERICYNYKSHEFGLLGGWESLDRLGTTRQPKYISEADHYGKFKTAVDICKASKINFSLMCTTNVDMAMKELWNSVEVTKQGTFDDGTYFILNQAIRGLVDARAEEICLATRILYSLSTSCIASPNKS